jgi:NADH-ubiquinone oxidoreductase chain 1
MEILKIIDKIELIIGVLLSTAYITLVERKVLGRIQRRVGPEIIGIYQPIIDGIKIMLKENIRP